MTSCPHCGCDIEQPPKKGKPRSVPQHRRYFAMIRAAHMHWPEAHAFQPHSENHLRKWLQAKCGHYTIDTIDAAALTPEQVVAMAAARMRAAGPYAFASATGTRLHIITPASIDFDTLPHLAACALFDDVAAMIEAETGIRADDMITHTPRKSGREQAVAGVPL